MNYQSPELKTYGSITEFTGTIDPSTTEDVDEQSGEEGTGSFSVVPSS